MSFNVEKNVNSCVEWLKDYLTNSGAKGFVLGVSGGKDSAVVASLLVKAVGSNKVFGVLMPNGEQADIHDSKAVCENLGISYDIVNINETYNSILKALPSTDVTETKINILPRLRMTTVYAVASEKGCLVAGTGNKSEKYVGYFTKWGDGAFDLNPIAEFTTDEVVAIGQYLGTYEGALMKKPSDGISGSSDEDKLGFTYKELNQFMETNSIENKENEQKIIKKHAQNQHKVVPSPIFKRV